MIIRTWRGYSSAANRALYPEHFRSNVLAELRAVSGFLGARLLESPDHDGFEFLVMTRWHSMEAIRAFAGDDPERAVVEPGAVRALLRFDERVRHYEVVEDADSPP